MYFATNSNTSNPINWRIVRLQNLIIENEFLFFFWNHTKVVFGKIFFDSLLNWFQSVLGSDQTSCTVRRTGPKVLALNSGFTLILSALKLNSYPNSYPPKPQFHPNSPCLHLPWQYFQGKTRFLGFLPLQGKNPFYPI